MESNRRDPRSLQDIALTNIAITLWTCSKKTIDLLDNYQNFTTEWYDFAKRLYQYNDLLLPRILMKRVDYLLPFIGHEIFKFVDYLSKKICLDSISLKYSLSKFCWKANGIIDMKKTVRILIAESTLNLSTCYKLACDFCLEEDILKIWKTLDVDQKYLFTSISNQSRNFLDNVSLWSIHNGELNTILSTKSTEQGFLSISLYKFICSIHEGVPDAVIYYWQKLPQEEKLEAIIVAMTMLENYFHDIFSMCASCKTGVRFHKSLLDDIVVFLFTQTTKEYLEILADELEFYFHRVLACFLEWNFLEFFISTFNKLQPFLEKYYYFDIIRIIENNSLSNCELYGNSYLLILEEVWTISSKANKESIYFHLPSLICSLLYLKNEKLVLRILNDLPISVREVLMFMDKGISECINLASENEWEILKILVELCVPEEKLENFKSLFGNQIQEKTSLRDSLSEMDLEIASSVYNFLNDVFKKC